MSIKLGVNIDHVATVREARKEGFPDLVSAARLALAAGADFIVVHLRSDRRHINDADIEILCKTFPKKIHMECAATKEMEKVALKYKPHSVCLVPEAPGELTTQGGLNLNKKNFENIKKMTANLKKAGIAVSLFVNPKAEDIRLSKKAGVKMIELCTADYSKAKNMKEEASLLEDLALSTLLGRELNLEVHSGHGLDYRQAQAVAQLDGMQSLNIGFSIIARSIFTGLGAAVMEMKEFINK
ncbi:pyridoxine 5-phosphate synthase [Elusimicrobium posterum]|uniref:pyridoxine 5'-phosphate synthase n=1 Tax=Elusimicrobium posterum TaxID=3116653 RepID=UPI003C72ECF2